MDNASDSIFALNPVTFRYKKEIDANQTPQFGLVAEEVARVDPDLVVRDRDGNPYTVRYEAVNAMLLNEFLKEHRKVQEQEATLAQLKSTLAKKETIDAHQQEQIEALTAGLQKVSAQLPRKWSTILKSRLVLGVSQRLIPTVEQSGLQTHRDDGKHFVIHADEKVDGVSRTRICD
jgi:uncharacterized coiled-coil protein SlyX